MFYNGTRRGDGSLRPKTNAFMPEGATSDDRCGRQDHLRHLMDLSDDYRDGFVRFAARRYRDRPDGGHPRDRTTELLPCSRTAFIPPARPARTIRRSRRCGMSRRAHHHNESEKMLYFENASSIFGVPMADLPYFSTPIRDAVKRRSGFPDADRHQLYDLRLRVEVRIISRWARTTTRPSYPRIMSRGVLLQGEFAAAAGRSFRSAPTASTSSTAARSPGCPGIANSAAASRPRAVRAERQMVWAGTACCCPTTTSCPTIASPVQGHARILPEPADGSDLAAVI